MKSITTWILVADGARARVYQNMGPGKGLTETPFPEMIASHAPTRDINADRPGRTFDSAGQGRHAMEPPTDPHRDLKRRFAKDVADFLEGEAYRNAFDRLIVVAPPKALGDLRGALGDHVSKRVTHEIPKDLTQYNVHELPQHLAEVIPL